MPVLIPPTENSYRWYDSAGRDLGLTSRQVSAIVKKHQMRKRRIYGCMAVNVADWDRYMKTRKEQNAAENA